MDRLAEALEEQETAAQLVARAVQGCRGAGLAWQDIGEAVGVTGEAARRRYGGV